MRTPLSMLSLLAITTLFGAATLYSGPILDQSFTNVTCSGCTSGLGQVLDEGFPFGGQTVTAGITGNLNSVSIFAIQRVGIVTPWIIDIVAAPGGIANGTLLGVSNPFALPLDDAWTSISIPSLPFMAAGTSFAIIIQLQGVTGPSPGLLAGVWSGGIFSTDQYTGGQPVFGNALNSLQLEGTFPGQGQGDLLFQTFVTPSPEPSTFVLTGGTFAIIAVWSWRRRRPRSR